MLEKVFPLFDIRNYNMTDYNFYLSWLCRLWAKTNNQCFYYFLLWLFLCVRVTLMWHGLQETVKMSSKVFGVLFWCSSFLLTFGTVWQLHSITPLPDVKASLMSLWLEKHVSGALCLYSLCKKRIQISFNNFNCALCESPAHSSPSLWVSSTF